jgi:hypothetical protein
LEITDANISTSYPKAKSISEKLFVLDYMLEVNGNLLDYLMCYQQTSPILERVISGLSPQALDAILKQVAEDVVIDDKPDIDKVITSIEQAVFRYAPTVVEQLKKDARFRSKLFIGLGSLLVVGAFASPLIIIFALNPALMAAGLAVIAYTAALISTIFLASFFLSEGYWYGQVAGRTSLKSDTIYPVLVAPTLSEEDEDSLFKREKDYTGTVTKAYEVKEDGKIERTSGSNFFFSHSKERSELRSEGMDEALKQEVTEAYNALQLS